ncbi:MAG TPA: hypothetical protein VGF99_18560 [Myxococcota bacterium]
MTTRFALRLDPPQSGWLPVTIVVDDDRFEWAASDVRNDVLEELADVALAIGDRRALQHTISLWLEPATIELRVVAASNDDIVGVTIVDADHETVLRAAVLTHAQLKTAIVDALVGLQASTSTTMFDREWLGFPDAQVRQLLDGRAITELLVEVRPPWRAIADLQRVRDELTLEAGPRHPLFGIALTIVAVDDDAGSYLVELARGPERFAVVTPTWSGAREAPPLPMTRLFRDWRAWRDGV